MDIKILENVFQLTIELVETSRTDFLHEDYGRSWSSQVEKWSCRGNLRVFLGIHDKKLTLIVRNLFSAGMCILQGTGS